MPCASRLNKAVHWRRKLGSLAWKIFGVRAKEIRYSVIRSRLEIAFKIYWWRKEYVLAN